MNIDWYGIEWELDIREDQEPEAIIHEIAHAYDCVGAEAFKRVGRQKEVGNLIESTYDTFEAQDLQEVRVSAVTLLVIQKLKVPHERQQVTADMCENLKRYPWKELQPKVLETFDAYLVDPKVQQAAEAITVALIRLS